jgi:hypothetical protein
LKRSPRDRALPCCRTVYGFAPCPRTDDEPVKPHSATPHKRLGAAKARAGSRAQRRRPRPRSPGPLWGVEQRRGGRRKGRACLSAASLRGPRPHRAAQSRPAQPDRPSGVAFLLVPFLWRSKEKTLARRGEIPAPERNDTAAPLQLHPPDPESKAASHRHESRATERTTEANS